jgi:phosphohistidine phosphatase
MEGHQPDPGRPMQRLILFRHAKAERRADSGEDYDRDLTDRGRNDAALMGRLLRDRDLGPDLVLVSGARRTRATWEAMADSFPAARVVVDDGLYDAPASALLAAAQSRDDAGTVMVIAHNPGLHEASMALLSRGRAGAGDLYEVRGGMPTATAGVFAMSGGEARLESWLLARDHGGGGGE